MTGRRRILGGCLCVFVGLPLFLPLVEGISRLDLRVLDFSHLFFLATTTMMLVAGVLGLALPVGVFLAVMLTRTNLPGRRWFHFITILLLFIPPSLHVMAWQAVLGSDGWFAWLTNAPGRPWIQGLLPAVGIHAVAAVPWVVVIVGVGLHQVERALEEEALLRVRPWHVLIQVTLPRCGGSIVAAGLWVALQTANDISVTDMLLVYTFAEEIHTQFTLGGGAGLARALTLALPSILILWGMLVGLAPRLERTLPMLQGNPDPPRTFDWPARSAGLWLVVLVLVVMLLATPALSLFWRLGWSGREQAWSVSMAGSQLVSTWSLNGNRLLWTMVAALGTGLLAAGLALVSAWMMLYNRGLRLLIWSLAALALAMPAPAIGLGLKHIINTLVAWWPSGPLAWCLYHTSPTPIIWVHIVRFFPVALAILWPVVRKTPRELREAAWLATGKPATELPLAIWPLSRRAFGGAILAVTALSLGEIGAAARVETPGWETFAKLLFDRMHYGVANDVAALGLLLLAGVALMTCLGGVMKIIPPRYRILPFLFTPEARQS